MKCETSIGISPHGSYGQFVIHRMYGCTAHGIWILRRISTVGDLCIIFSEKHSKEKARRSIDSVALYAHLN